MSTINTYFVRIRPNMAPKQTTVGYNNVVTALFFVNFGAVLVLLLVHYMVVISNVT